MAGPSRIGDVLYRAILRCFPADVRAAHGEDMVRQFAGERRAAGGRPLALARLWVRAAGDAVWNGLLERLAIGSSITEGHVPDMGSGYERSGLLSRAGRAAAAAMTRDVALALRRFRATPGFTLMALITLALGIGANSAIFSVVHGVVLKPLPFQEPDRLVGVFQVWKGDRDVISPPNFLDLQARMTTLESAAAYDDNRMTLTNAGEPASIIATSVTSGFFETLRTAPLAGRTFRRDENETGRAHVAVLGHALWRSRFGGDPAIVGRSITLDGKAYEVVGVMPAGFNWPLRAELWVPAEYTETFRVTNRGAWILDAIGRLKPDVTLDRAKAEFASLGRQLEQQYPEMNKDVGMTVHPLLDSLVGDSRRALFVLLAAVGFVMLIACANVANLMLARATAREEELSVRVALGAGRWDLIRQVGIESLVLAIGGGAAGLALAVWGTRVLVALRPGAIPRLGDATVDGSVVAFTAGVTVLTALLFGLVPALLVGRRSISETLRERGRGGTAGRRGHRLRSGLVVAETALAVMLLAGAGLLIRSFVRLSHVDPGFVVGEAVTFSLGLPETAYDSDAKRGIFYDDLRSRLAALPGVSGVGIVLAIPPTSPIFNLSFGVAGRPPKPPGDSETLEVRVADAAYFHVMGIRLTRGRLFSDADRMGTTPVALLTESAALRYFPNEDPIGRHIDLGWKRNKARVGGDIVGVVSDVKSLGLDQSAPPQIYVALAQLPNDSMSFVVRTTGQAATLFDAVRKTVSGLDASLPVNRLETLDHHVRQSIAEPRFYMLLLAIFAGVAVLLAAVGIFGVLSYLVSQRTREIGVRIALGAGPGRVIGLVLRQTMWLSGAGILTGTIGALAISTVLQKLLFDLAPDDPVTFTSAALGLMFVSSVAAWIPAQRATSVDPTRALRD